MDAAAEQWQLTRVESELRALRDELNLLRGKLSQNVKEKARLQECEEQEQDLMHKADVCKRKLAELGADAVRDAMAAAAVDASRAGEQLRLAAGEGDVETVVRLCMTGVVNDASAPDRFTALHKASMYGHTDVIHTLLAANAHVQPCDVFGRTPLMLAAANGFVDIVRALLSAGANAGTLENKKGWNAFMFAAERGAAACCSALAEKGGAMSALSTRGKDGRSAIEIARSKGRPPAFLAFLRDLHEAGGVPVPAAAEKAPRDVRDVDMIVAAPAADLATDAQHTRNVLPRLSA